MRERAAGLVGIAISGALGYGLWTFTAWGRLGAAGFTALGVILHVVSPVAGGFSTLVTLVWSGAVLWALLAEPASWITTPPYRSKLQTTANIKVRWYLSPFFWVPLLPLALALVAVLGMVILGL